MKKDSFFEARLLSERKQLTVQEKESILDAVVAEIGRGGERRSLMSFLKNASIPVRVASAVAVLLLLAVPLMVVLSPPDTAGEFAARGGKGTARSNFSVSCLRAKHTGECQRGDKLVFRVTPPEDRPYFASFARHLPSQAVIWYFPDAETSESPLIGDISKDGVLSQGIKLGDEHAAGQYEIYGLFFRTPVRRKEIRELFGEHFDPQDSSFTVSKVTLSVKNNN